MIVLLNFVGDFDSDPKRILPEFRDMCPGSAAFPCLHSETSAGSTPRQLLTSTAGDTSISDDSGIRCLSILALLDTHFISGGTAGARLFEPDDMISCTQLPCLYALLEDNSILDVWAGKDMSDLVCFISHGTDMGPVYYRWSVGLFALYALRTRLNYTLVLGVETAMGDDGLL